MLSSAGWCWRQGVHCQHQAHRPLQSGRGCSAPWRVHAQPGLIDMLERHQGEVEEVANLIRDISSKLPVTRDWAMLKSSMSSMSQSYARAPLQRASTSTTGPGNAATWDWQEVSQLTILGLGSLDTTTTTTTSPHRRPPKGRLTFRAHQLALSLALQQLLPGLPPGHKPVFIDPSFSEFDIALIQQLGGIAVAAPALQHPEYITPPRNGGNASQQQGSPTPAPAQQEPPVQQSAQDARASSSSTPATTTSAGPPRLLLYMPCCTSSLYAQVLDVNLKVGSLPNVAILGNSFSTQGATFMLFNPALFRAAASGPGGGGTSKGSGPVGVSGGGAGTGGVSGSRGVPGLPMSRAEPRDLEQAEEDEESSAFAPPVFQAFTQARAFVEVPCPDCGAHGVAVGLHAFPPHLLQKLKLGA